MSGVDPRVRRALDDLAGEVAPAHGLFSRVEQRVAAHSRRRRGALAGVVVVTLLVSVLGIPALLRDDKPRRVAAGPGDPSVDSSMPGRVAAVTTDGRLLVIDSVSGETLSELEPTVSKVSYTEVSATPDGLTLFVGTQLGGEMIHRRDLASGQETYVARGSWPSVSPDGRRLAFVGPNASGTYGAGDTLHVVELETGEERTWPVDPDDPGTGRLSPPRWSPDSRRLVFRAQTKDGSPLLVFDTERGSSVADARTVWSVNIDGISGYLGTTGDLLGVSDADPEGGSLSEKGLPQRVVALDARTGEVTRDLFELRGAQQPVADATGRHVLAIDGDGALHRWSDGADRPTELANGVAAATWLPDAVAAEPTTTTAPLAVTAGGEWEMLPEAPISGRSYAATVWTGAEMVVWGGEGKDRKPLGDGAAYDPTTRKWRTVAAAPIERRIRPVSVWTGTEMIVWGGFTAPGGELGGVVDGAAYDPGTDSWRTIAEAPINVAKEAWAVWTDGEMVVGLRDLPAGNFVLIAYSPADDAWRTMSRPPGSAYMTAIWTGGTLLVWCMDPLPNEAYLPQGYAYVSATDSWRRLASVPTAGESANDIFGFEPVAWTGEVVVGKRGYGTLSYDPATDRYRDAAGGWGNGGGARVWTGREVIDWGGSQLDGDTYQADGIAYDVFADTVGALPPSPLQGRQSPAAVWTGEEMLVWGGLRERASGGSYSWFADGASYRPPDATPTSTVDGGEPATIIAAVGDGGVVEIDASDGSVLRTIASGRPGWWVYSVEVDGARGSVFYNESAECDDATLWQVPLVGGEPKQVSRGMEPAVSPDGRRLAFPVDDGCAVSALVLHEIESGGERIWRDVPSEYWGAEWAPDGQRLAVGVYSREAGVLDAEIRILDSQNRDAVFASSPMLTHGILEDSVIADGRWVLAVVRPCDHDADMECKDEVVTVDGDTGEQIESFGLWHSVDDVDLDATGRHALVLASEETEPGHSQEVMFAVESGGRGRRIAPAFDADW